MGDAALRGVAEKTVTVLRPYDSLGRYGGDEFLVVLPGCDATTAAALAERVRRAIDATPIPAPGGPFRVTLSIGGATLGADSSPAALLRRADDALYSAKHAGRNCFQAA
jgi:two-component system cell cycle response regulator